MKEVHPNIGGKEMPFTYADCQEAMDRFNTIFFEVFEEGDSIGNIFQYPILTVNVTPDFRWDHPVTEKLFKLDAKYGSFYFTNMVNSDMKPEDLRSMCATKDTLIEVELEEDIVEHEGKYYTLEQAVKKGLVVLDETHTNFVCVTDQSDVKSETKC
jgi:ribonucleoside-triphosphate reductase